MSESVKLSKLLKRVYLGGIIEEAVVDMDTYTIQAVDVTNSLFLKVTEDGTEKGIGKIGIGNLSLVTKFLDTFKGEIGIKKNGNRLVISSEGRGELKYLMVDPDFIPTIVNEDNTEALLSPCVIKVDLEKTVCTNFSTYFSLLKPKSAKIIYDTNSKAVSVESGLLSDHQFNLPIGIATVLGGKDAPQPESFSISVFCQHFDQILNVLEWDEKNKPWILMAPEHPLLVVLNDKNIWALLPLAETIEE